MAKPVFDTGQERSILEHIREGMRVLDADNSELGTVDYVYLGEVSPLADGALGPASIPANDNPTDPFLEMIHSVFGNQDLPKELRERLMQHGFIHINVPGLLAHNRFVLPDQITTVMDDAVILKAKHRELIKE